jgi:hypothetical protein
MAKKKIKYYNIWLQVEACYTDKNGIEQHQDIEAVTSKYGEYKTLEEAERIVNRMEFDGGLLDKQDKGDD